MAAAIVTGCGGGGSSCPNDLPSACPANPPSYSNDIAQIISNRCFPCHAPGGVEATTPLTTYQQVFNQRSAVLDQVYHCNMPLAGAPTLTPTQRTDLLTWLVCNAPNN
jgi:hypothetical protein